MPLACNSRAERAHIATGRAAMRESGFDGYVAGLIPLRNSRRSVAAASRWRASAVLAAVLALSSAPVHSAFILQFSENAQGTLTVDTVNAPGSPVGDANISDKTKVPF